MEPFTGSPNEKGYHLFLFSEYYRKNAEALNKLNAHDERVSRINALTELYPEALRQELHTLLRDIEARFAWAQSFMPRNICADQLETLTLLWQLMDPEIVDSVSNHKVFADLADEILDQLRFQALRIRSAGLKEEQSAEPGGREG